MIEPGDGWRFRETLDEHSLVHEQLVDHVVTGAMARRRVYMAKAMADDEAVEAARAHAALIARRRTPRLPALVGIESIEGHLCVSTQHLAGEPLDVMLRRGAVSDPRRWAALAMRLARLCKAMEADHAGFQRLLLRDVIDCRGVLAVARWAPMGALPPGRPDPTSVLARLADPAFGGAVAHDGPIPLREAMQRLKDLLYEVATGRPGATMDAALAADRGNMAARGSGLGIELPIEKVLLRLHEADKPNGLRTLEGLMDVLDSMLPERPRPWVRPAAGRRAQPAAEATPGAIPQRETSERAAELAPFLKASIEEDAEEDRRYLYPGRPAETVEQDGEDAVESALFRDAQARAERRAQPGAWIKPVALTIVALAVVIGGYLAVNALLSKPPINQPPVAIFTLDAPQVRVREQASLDGAASTDPEGERLRFEWKVDDVARTEYRFSAETEPVTTVQFFAPGSYTIRLEVWDGLNKASSTAEISVLPGED